MRCRNFLFCIETEIYYLLGGEKRWCLLSARQWQRYQYLRRLNEEMVFKAFERYPELKDDLFRMKECGKYINGLECKKCGAKHFAGFNRCKKRFCLACNHVRLLMWLARIKLRVDELLDDYYPAMITFTVRDSDDLEERIRFIEGAWRLLKNGNKKWRKIFSRRFVGGVRSLEVKIGKNSGEWHVHYHCLVMIPRTKHVVKDFYWLRKAWKQCTKEQGSIEIHQIRDRGKGLNGAICEVVKYIVKPEKKIYEDDRFIDLYWALKNKRQINTWGLFRGMSREIESDIDKMEEKKIEQFVCSICGCTEAELKMYVYNIYSSEIFYDIQEEKNIQ